MPMRNLLSQLLAVGPELAAFILTSPLLGAKGAYAITPVSAPSPNLDLSQLGRVAVAGDFDSISLYQYQGQTEDFLTNNGSQSLFTQYSNGGFDSLASSDASIVAMCQFERGGKVQGVVVGGNFTSLGGVEAQSVALWNPDTNSITPLPGINGVVSSLYCDNSDGTVYVGGMFTAGHSQNAMSWTTGWENLPFAGFNGPVNTIQKNAAGNIVFGGQFDGLGSGQTTSNVQSVANSQAVNLGGGNITAEGSTSTLAGFEDPSNIVCTTGIDGPGNTWLLADNRGGYWEGSYGFGFIPTKLRLFNTNYQGRGTKSFAFENLANGGFLEFNFTGPSGNTELCAGSCPLPQGTTEPQDFYFTQPVGCNNFRIWINEWYGDGAGFSGIEMFQDDIYSFAINSFNEPNCDSVSNASTSVITPASGLWTEVINNGSTTSDYLSAYLTDASQTTSTSVVFSPNIPDSGNYSIIVFTPGCIPDGTCATRGLVNLTGTMTAGQPPISTTIAQTNDYDKYDQIYFGYVDPGASGFKPTVTLAPIANGPLPQTIVAQRVRFEVVTSTGGLNGLYEYNPNQATVNTKSFSSSAVDNAGTNLSTGAMVNAIVWDSSTGYVGGSFSGNGISNILSISSKASSLPNGGLNDVVQDVLLYNSILYVGGNFTGTTDASVNGLANVASFDTSSNKWAALGAGVAGSVNSIVTLELNVTTGSQETCIAVSGDFSSVNAYGSNSAFDVQGMAIWVPSKSTWLNNIPDVAISVSGQISAQTTVSGMQFPLYGGQAQSEAQGLSGAVELVGSGMPSLEAFGVNIQDLGSSTTSTRKRALSSNEISSGVYTGFFYNQNGVNITALGGHFNATGSNGNAVQNLVIIKESGSKQTVSGVSQLDSNSTITVLENQNNLLFAGGSISGTVSGNNLGGLIVYNMQSDQIASPQPPALTGSSVVVNAIAPQPKTNLVYIGGDFAYAGALPCNTLCVYDTSREQWNSAGLGLSGTIESLVWMSNTKLVIAGNLVVNGASTSMATYDSTAKTQSFTVFTGADSLPGNITTLAPANSAFSSFWAAGIASKNGSAYLSLFQNDQWTAVGGLGAGTIIRSLQMLSLTHDHSSTALVPSSDSLLIAGNINVSGFGNASAVLFNGTSFTPLLLTSKNDGSQGSVSQIFVSNPQNLLHLSHHHLAVGFVVLIGLAIALGLIFLLVVAGILVERLRRRREGYVPMRNQRGNGNMDRIPPETLLGRLGEKGDPPKL